MAPSSHAVAGDRTSARERVSALDAIRGIAILGTLGTNIWIFTNPYGMLASSFGPAVQATDPAQVWLVVLTNGKFLGLLSLLFGMGVAIQYRSARRRQIRWPGTYLWRAALLLLDGFINYVLIAEFDVLMGYAITGVIVAWMFLASDRTQRTLTIVFASLHVALIALIAIAVSVFPPLPTPERIDVGPSPYATMSFGELAVFRLENFAQFRAEPILILFLSIAMFLLGARLFRAGVFDLERKRLRRGLVIAGAIAAPIDVVLGVFGGLSGPLVGRYVAAPIVAAGLLGLLAELFLRRGTASWAGRRLREIGRTALSCYMLQNLLGAALFYGWGLGLAASIAEFHLAATIGGYVVISVLVVVFAHLWLRFFTLGPVEWVWKKAGGLIPDTPRPAVGS